MHGRRHVRRAEEWGAAAYGLKPRAFASPMAFLPREIEVLADLSAGLSGSDIREGCARLKRRALTSGDKSAHLKDAFAIVQNLALTGEDGQRFAATLSDKDLPAVVQALRTRDARLYSLAVIAELVGLSKATVHRVAQKGREDGGRT